MGLFYLESLAKQFSYNKKEKLKSRKQLDEVFSAGKSFTIFPIKVFYIATEYDNNLVSAGVGVSSRNFKKAVERNRIKRLLREAYRTEKILLHSGLEKNRKKLAIFFLYVDKILPEYVLIKEKMSSIIKRLIELNEVGPENT